jgi:acyl dehydratase
MSRYEVQAYNTAHASENKIHDDAVARGFGFTGALVPGVEVYAYMMHLPVARWGREFLERGEAECRFAQPVYDGETAEMAGAEERGRLAIEVRSRGVVCATGSARMPQAAAEPGDAFGPCLPPPMEQRSPASAESLRVGTMLGCRPLELSTQLADDYLRDVREADDLYRREGLAHPGMVLRMCNQALLQTVRLGPWIHVGSKVQNLSVARVGETLSASGRVTANYERKGHRFVEFDAVVVARGRPVARVLHTAIYQPRQVAAA